MLRTIFVIVIVVFGVVYAFQGPFNILLFYLWFAYFRPEYWLWNPEIVLALNLSLLIGVVLVLSSLGSLHAFRWTERTVLVVLFFLQSVLSLLASEHFTWSLTWWMEFAKTIVIALLITVLVSDIRRYRLALVVIAYSLGLEAAKQGWAQMILNPGGTNNNTNPMLGDNNGVATGMVMLLPCFAALAQTATRRSEKWVHRFFIVGILYRAISTYSRGGFLAAGAVGLVMLWYSPRKVRAVVTIAVLCGLVLTVMPKRFWDRMHTITVSQDARDEASEGRLTMWGVAIEMADARPITGIGFNGFETSFDRYDTTSGLYGNNRAVHSAWFGVLADMGYPGLLLLIGIVASTIRAMIRVRRLTRGNPAVRDLRVFASAMLASMVAYAVGMTFLSGQYMEMFWHFVALSIAIEGMARSGSGLRKSESLKISSSLAAPNGPGRLLVSGHQAWVTRFHDVRVLAR